jgi:hypothetical protein
VKARTLPVAPQRVESQILSRIVRRVRSDATSTAVKRTSPAPTADRQHHRGRRLGVVVAALLLLATAAVVVMRATSAGDGARAPVLGHVHGLGVNPADGVVFAGSHYGLFRLSATQPPVRVADRVQDYMGFTVVGPNQFLASGHPAEGSLEPKSLGLIESTDAGNTWTSRSLAGRADFHALQARHGRVYGYNAITGAFMVSTDLTNWETRATVPIADFAVSPTDPELILATTEQGLVRSTDGGRTFAASPGPVLLLLSWVGGALAGVTPDGRVQVSEDNGISWQLRGTADGAPEALEAVTRSELYLAVKSAVLVSTDGGHTFSPLAGT